MFSASFFYIDFQLHFVVYFLTRTIHIMVKQTKNIMENELRKDGLGNPLYRLPTSWSN